MTEERSCWNCAHREVCRTATGVWCEYLPQTPTAEQTPNPDAELGAAVRSMPETWDLQHQVPGWLVLLWQPVSPHFVTGYHDDPLDALREAAEIEARESGA